MKNAPATFQRLVNHVLAQLEDFSEAYLDDIAVFSSTREEHLQHLCKVLEALKKALRKAGLTIKSNYWIRVAESLALWSLNPLQMTPVGLFRLTSSASYLSKSRDDWTTERMTQMTRQGNRGHSDLIRFSQLN
ncbi:hypothetical protein NDU88_007248 [Pleurodeles waltl]|uniref:ribonuclease H n=1 Tax=Pleurodeles waltl TaxID=8319 RepID=A0AAV7TZG5_PLEWA|nr:hypothetical protein NDU88_007248 [Pleurodeles waltl]